MPTAVRAAAASIRVPRALRVTTVPPPVTTRLPTVWSPVVVRAHLSPIRAIPVSTRAGVVAVAEAAVPAAAGGEATQRSLLPPLDRGRALDTTTRKWSEKQPA